VDRFFFDTDFLLGATLLPAEDRRNDLMGSPSRWNTHAMICPDAFSISVVRRRWRSRTVRRCQLALDIGSVRLNSRARHE